MSKHQNISHGIQEFKLLVSQLVRSGLSMINVVRNKGELDTEPDFVHFLPINDTYGPLYKYYNDILRCANEIYESHISKHNIDSSLTRRFTALVSDLSERMGALRNQNQVALVKIENGTGLDDKENAMPVAFSFVKEGLGEHNEELESNLKFHQTGVKLMSKRPNIACEAQSFQESHQELYNNLVRSSYAMIAALNTGAALTEPSFLSYKSVVEGFSPMVESYNRILSAAVKLYDAYTKNEKNQGQLIRSLMVLLPESQESIDVEEGKVDVVHKDGGRKFSEIYGVTHPKDEIDLAGKASGEAASDDL